jgi:hypothetical protein
MIIGISGKKGSGKSTISEMFLTEGFYLDSFATSVKDIAAIIFNYDRTKIEGFTGEDRIWRENIDNEISNFLGRPFRPRDSLTIIGTEFGRNMIHPDIWIKTVFDRYKSNENKNLVITDLRFPNEFESIKKHKGYTIRIHRPCLQQNIPNNIVNEHISETALDSKEANSEFDYIIINDGTIEDLKIKIKNIINNIKLK